MKKYWRQFEEWVIGLTNNLFFRARLKLTAFYIILIAVIMAIFSLALYHSLLNNLNDGFSDQENGVIQNIAIDRTIDSLQNNIIIIDISVLLLAIILSFFLAGKTLIPIKKSLEAQQQFSANASHELRMPLTIMKTDTEVTLRDSQSTIKDFRLLAKSNLEEVERMSKMVEDLLILSRSENLAVNDFVKINLSNIIAEIIKKINPLTLAKNITVTYLKNNDQYILGQPEAIKRMVFNILQNAVNYTSENGNIEVGLKNEDKFLELVIIDNGVGISENDLPHIFERFYKVDKARDVETKGTGLGLSIVKEIISNHQGNIVVTSKIGQGTQVFIKLPKKI